MTTIDLDHRIPIRLDPLPGEAFDSWLAAYAVRLDCPIPDLARAITIPQTVFFMPATNLAIGRPAPNPETVARAACGLDPHQLEATWLPLSRYADKVQQRLGKSALTRAARPMPASRYCPGCLASNEGRWLAAWRLPWFVACPQHHTFLLSVCPECGGAQRLRPLQYNPGEASTARCTARRPAGSDDDRPDCGCNLGSAQPGTRPSAELLAWQNHLAGVIDPEIDDTGLTRLVDHLADQIVLARIQGLRSDSLHRRAPVDAYKIGIGLLRAYRLQADPKGRAMRQLALADVNKRPWPLTRGWRYASPDLAAVVLRHRDARLRASDRLRYRTATDLAKRPERRDARQRQRWVPLAIWPEWAIRLTLPTSVQPNLYRAASAIAICLAGTSQNIASVVETWSTEKGFDREISRVFQLIGSQRDGTIVIAALTLLADHLDRYGAPIDYQRRRQLADDIDLVDHDSWDAICRASGAHTGHSTKLRAARLWTWETLTGGEPHQAPPHLRPTTSNELTDYHLFALRLPPTAGRLLDQHARTLLDTHGCESEPLTWSPRPTSIDLGGLPGPDPGSVNPEDVHRLLRQGLAPGTAAQTLGISLDHLRYIVRRHPPNLRGRSTGKRVVLRYPMPPHLTANALRSLIDSGHGIRQIAAESGITRGAIREELVRHGIAIPSAGVSKHHRIDPEWLRREYLVQLRTLNDLAIEAGTTPTTLAKVAHGNGIPVRRPGGGSHQSSLTGGDGYPHPLAAALHGPAGLERVRRFQIYATMRSLNAAALHAGLRPSVLVTQLKELESACGGRLIVRTPPQQDAQQLTDLGLKLLRQADRQLGSNPDAPPKHPHPLSAALNAFWGASRLDRFLITASSKSLNDAVEQIGTNLVALRKSVRGLGDALGGPLILEARPNSPVRLTPLGRKLRRQAIPHADDLKDR